MIDPVEERLSLAGHYCSIQQPQRAAEVLGDLPAEALDLPWTWLLRAHVAGELHGAEAKAAAARDGLARFPEDLDLLIAYAEALVDLQDLATAEEVLLRALSRAPEDVEALCDYAIVCALAGQVDKARKLVERAAAIDPESRHVWLARYRIAHFEGDDRETQRLARHLAELSGGDPAALTMLGVEAAKSGDHRQAWRHLQRAASADASVVERLGRDVMLDARALHHPLLVGMWPVERFGAGAIWLVMVGVFLLGSAMDVDGRVMLGIAAVYVLWAIYTWVAPPLVRWLTGAR